MVFHCRTVPAVNICPCPIFQIDVPFFRLPTARVYLVIAFCYCFLPCCFLSKNIFPAIFPAYFHYWLHCIQAVPRMHTSSRGYVFFSLSSSRFAALISQSCFSASSCSFSINSVSRLMTSLSPRIIFAPGTLW